MKVPFLRMLTALLIVTAFLVAPLAPVAQAATTASKIPVFGIAKVAEGESVTIHTYDFPANHTFDVLMGKIGTRGIGGIAAGAVESGEGGSFEATFNIPADLKNEKLIAIRLQSSSGYYAYNWFVNRSAEVTPVKPDASKPETPSTPTTPVKPVYTTKALLTILSVDKDVSVKVRADNLPANQTFTIRIGTYYNFFRDYKVVGTFDSGAGGSLEWTSNLPEHTKGVEWVSIRIDSNYKVYAYNAFKNIEGGLVSGNITSPAATTGTTSGTASGQCQIVSVTPTTAVKPFEDFDAVWTVKNTSGKTWDASSVDYVYVSGDEMHQASKYDLSANVDNNATHKIIVDMKAPGFATTQAEKWAIVQGDATLCTLTISVTVK